MAASPNQREVRDLLLAYIHPDYAENSETVKHQITVVTERTSDIAAETLLEVERAARGLGVPREAIRTRQTKHTQMGWGVGLAIYNRPIVKGRCREVLGCILPSEGGTSRVEFWVSGVSNDTSGLTSPKDQVRCEMPVRHAIVDVTRDNQADIMRAVDQWLREGRAQCA
jgi:hypothetical protein